MSRRFAIYYAPPPGSALERFGCAWLGRDHATGAPLEQPRIDGLTPERLAEVTRFPRHYGFHATLKAPFSLAPGRRVEELEAAVGTFAAGRGPFACAPLQVTTLSGFIAFTPTSPCPALDDLAHACVRAFEPFRAPLSDEEVARRHESRLTPRQKAYLRAWGYPYVFEEFCFHMTLTGRLEEPERSRILAVLEARSAVITRAPLNVDAIALYEQADREQPFLMRVRHPFGRGV